MGHLLEFRYNNNDYYLSSHLLSLSISIEVEWKRAAGMQENDESRREDPTD